MADTDSQTVIGGGVTSETAQVLVTEANLLAMGNESGYIGVNTDVPVSFLVYGIYGEMLGNGLMVYLKLIKSRQLILPLLLTLM